VEVFVVPFFRKQRRKKFGQAVIRGGLGTAAGLGAATLGLGALPAVGVGALVGSKKARKGVANLLLGKGRADRTAVSMGLKKRRKARMDTE
jgi:hypothetical protein